MLLPYGIWCLVAIKPRVILYKMVMHLRYYVAIPFDRRRTEVGTYS